MKPEISTSLKRIVDHFATRITTSEKRRELDTVLRAYKFGNILQTLDFMRSQNPSLYHHSVGVADSAAKLAENLGLNAQYVHQLQIAGCMHDVGKLLEPHDENHIKNISKGGTPTKIGVDAENAHPATSLQFAMLTEPNIEPQFLGPILTHHIWYKQPDTEIFGLKRFQFERFVGEHGELVGDWALEMGQMIAVADVWDSAVNVKKWVNQDVVKPPTQALQDAATEKFAGGGIKLNPYYTEVFLSKVVPFLKK